MITKSLVKIVGPNILGNSTYREMFGVVVPVDPGSVKVNIYASMDVLDKQPYANGFFRPGSLKPVPFVRGLTCLMPVVVQSVEKGAAKVVVSSADIDGIEVGIASLLPIYAG